MSADEVALIDKLRDLSITAAHELLTGVDRLKVLSEELSGESRSDGESVSAAKQKVRGIAYDFARAELEHAERLLSLSHKQADLLFAHAQRLMRVVRGGGQLPPSVIEIVGAIGGEAVAASFPVRNGFAGPADIRFELDQFKDNVGRTVAWAPDIVTLKCSPSPIPARSNANVDVSVKLPAGILPGLYFSKLVVHLSAEIERPTATRLVKIRAS